MLSLESESIQIHTLSIVNGKLGASKTWWGPERGAVLPGRKHERSEASSARGMRGRLRGLRAGRPTPRAGRKHERSEASCCDS